MPSAYRKMLGARPLTNWTIIDIWRPPRVGAAHLTEKLPLDPDSEGELDAIVKRSIPVRRAWQGRRVEKKQPSGSTSLNSLIERGGTLSAPRFPSVLAFPRHDADQVEHVLGLGKRLRLSLDISGDRLQGIDRFGHLKVLRT